MTDQGDRAPKPESAASIAGRSAAIDAAFADIPDFPDDDYMPSAVASEHRGETPTDDDQLDAHPQDKAKPEDTGKPVDDPERPVEGQEALPKSQDALEAPKHWPADRRSSFQALPDDAKRIILDRNKEANVAVTKAQQEAAQYRKTSEAVTSLFNDDHRSQMQNANMDEIAAMRYLVQQHDALNRDPVGFLRAVIAQTGVKAEQLFAGAPVQQHQQVTQPPVEEEWKDPAVIALEAKYAALEQWKTTQEQDRLNSRRTEQQNLNSWFNEQCLSFENAINDEGLPKYPHLPAVIQDVVRLVQTDPAAKQLLTSRPQEALEKAYNQAIYLHPEIRQQIIDADFAQRMAAHDNANSVKKAQAAATRRGSPGANGQAKVGFPTRAEAIDAAMREAGIM